MNQNIQQQENTGTLSLLVLTILVAVLMGIEAKSSLNPPAVGHVIEAASLTTK